MQKLRFSTSTPCNQSLDKMQPNELGHFCGQCNKTVVDFSKMTDDEILNFLKNRLKKDSLCVSMTKEQDNQGIQLNQRRIAFPKFLRKVAAITLVGFTVMGIPILVNGQSTVEGRETEIPKAKAKTITIEVPATYQTIEIQKVKTPPKIIKHKIPAEYHTIERQQLVSPGGVVEWREILCEMPEEHEITIELKILKQKLKEKGYFEGEIDNVLTEELKAALIAFKQENKLLPAFELDNDTMYLLGISDK